MSGEINSTMFRRKLGEDLKAIEQGMEKLARILQTAIRDNIGNQPLLYIEKKFNSYFYPVLFNLQDFYRSYTSCCLIFDPVYLEYSKISERKGKETRAKFRKTVKRWEGRVLVKYMIETYINYVRNKLSEFANGNSVFHSMLNEAKQLGTIMSNIKTWEAIGVEISTIDGCILNLKQKECPDVNEFLSDIKKSLGIEVNS